MKWSPLLHHFLFQDWGEKNPLCAMHFHRIVYVLHELKSYFLCKWVLEGYSISQEICTRFFALLCFVVVIHWLIFPYPSGLLHWHCGNLTIGPVPAKQPWWIWINTSCEFIMNDCITTTKQSTTKPCAYFLGYTVDDWSFSALLLSGSPSWRVTSRSYNIIGWSIAMLVLQISYVLESVVPVISSGTPKNLTEPCVHVAQNRHIYILNPRLFCSGRKSFCLYLPFHS